MTFIIFIDQAYPLFAPRRWREGVTIYHSGQITKINQYGELVSGTVIPGPGERYEVRLKLHAHGKCVQWMECTCSDYRRRNEKCAHMAALCIYLDRDRADILRNLNLGAGYSDKYLLLETQQEQEKAKPTTASENPGTQVNPSIKLDPVRWFSNLESNKNVIKSIELDQDAYSFCVEVGLGEGRDISYRLGVDEVYQILQSHSVKKWLHKKFTEGMSTYAVKRFFSLMSAGQEKIKITRSIGVIDKKNAEVIKTFHLDGLKNAQSGRLAVCLEEYGILPFLDNLSSNQVMRWEEYPKTAFLEGENAASLVLTKFERLRETADVKLSDDIAKMQVWEDLGVTELSVKTSKDGLFEVETAVKKSPTVVEKNENTEKAAVFSKSLLEILKARKEGKQFVAIDGGWIKVTDDYDWLMQKVDKDGKLKLSNLDLIKFKEKFARDGKIVGQNEIVNKVTEGLLSYKATNPPEFKGTNLNLRPYQLEGLKWLWWLYENKLGGLLADEMGLGKTHQAMALLAGIHSTSKTPLQSLVVCPTSVIDHWLDKMREYIPNVSIQLYYGSHRRADSFLNPKQHQVVLTSYGIMLRDVDFLHQCPWEVVVLDEAHVVKNQTTRTYRAACRLSCKMRLCLTGTPLENDLLELKNLFDFIAPNYLGTDNFFKKKYMREQRDPMLDLELRRLIHPFKMRRIKTEVLDDLPEKVEDIRYCHLNTDQFKLYQEALALKGAPLVDVLRTSDQKIPYVHIFSVISLLKQICNDPALIDEKYADVGSGKLDVFNEILQEAIDSDQKVVVFSQYAKMIDRLSSILTHKGISHVTLTGSTTKRGEVVRKFQEDSTVKVFLGSLLAGGTGIDLTAANVVIHYDRWWNAAKENQATDRVHRIGQMKNVQVIKLVVRGSLEERIDEIIRKKRTVFDKFVEQSEDVFKHLDRDELLKLLAPLGQAAEQTLPGVDIQELSAADTLG